MNLGTQIIKKRISKQQIALDSEALENISRRYQMSYVWVICEL